MAADERTVCCRSCGRTRVMFAKRRARAMAKVLILLACSWRDLGLLRAAAAAPRSAEDFVPEGWRMADRFHGFRYEVYGQVQDVGFRQGVVAVADELGCFGWVQNTPDGTVVGEARCGKTKGPKLIEWLQRGPAAAEVESVMIKTYEDTKIKLHFSYFKILDDDRVTCFRDIPHQCAEFAPSTETGAEEGGASSTPKDGGEGGARSEL